MTDKLARKCLEGVLEGEGDPAEVMSKRGLELVQDDGALDAAVAKVVDANPDIVAKVQSGKTKAVGALVGQVMKEMRGKADAAKASQLLLKACQEK